MNNNIKNVNLVVKLLKKHNISNIVISPGGTNISFVNAVTTDSFFNCYSVVDERSAIYFAIGIFLQTGQPVATSCTSAQATRNYIPGLTEAFYKRVPILAITMSKHPRFTYQEYMQAPNQTSLPEDCVKRSVSLPFICDNYDYLHSNRLINEAILELTKGGYGPVQLNIPILDFEDNYDFSHNTVRQIKCYNISQEWNIDLSHKKIMIVIGEHLCFSEELKQSIDLFCQKYNVVIYTNHLSNFSNDYCVNANLFLSVQDHNVISDNLIPNVMISIGGQTGDYPFYNTFSKHSLINVEHWRVSSDGKIVDTYDKLTKVFDCSELDFFNKVNSLDTTGCNTYCDMWKNEIDKMNTDIELPFSSVYLAQFLHDKLPLNSIIQFSILHSLRVWNYFQLDSSIQCFSNVGAFGIDGGLSTLIGQSIIRDDLCYMIIGDLAFYYDMNSIGIRHIKPNLKIILVNNNGGVEFKYKSGSNVYIDKYVAAANHFKNAKGWAETCGFDYYSANNKKEFVEKHSVLLEKLDKPILFEVFVSDDYEANAYNKIIDTNSKNTMKRVVKKLVQKIRG